MASAPGLASKGRLVSIDALRGIAAIGVTLYHIVGGFTVSGGGGTVAAVFNGVSSFGFTGVYLFFVISGFCIHLRWARAKSTTGSAAVHFVAFWKRRFWRLYPPYLAAVVLYIAVGWYYGTWRFSLYDITVHLLMLHNLDARTVYSLNGAFWTLAIEEQLYLAYFFLVWMRGHFGWRWSLAFCLSARVAWFAVGFLLNRAAGIAIPVEESALAHWFEWGLGALAVEYYFGLTRPPAWVTKRWFFCAALAVAAIVTYLHRGATVPPTAEKFLWFAESPAWGVAFFLLVALASHRDGQLNKVRFSRVVAALAAIGFFSYSLYLSHEAVLQVVWHTGLRRQLALAGAVPADILLLLLCIVASWVYFRLIERHFLPSSPSHEAKGGNGKKGTSRCGSHAAPAFPVV